MAIDRAAEHRALASAVWRQVFELFVRTRGQREHVLQRYQLSPNDAKTLCMMEATVAKPMRALADLCCTDASNATWVVDRLESHGLVERKSVPGDRRVKLVGLTARGVKIRQAILEAMHEPPLEVLALQREDLVAFGKILDKIPLLSEPVPVTPSVGTVASTTVPAVSAATAPVSKRARHRRAARTARQRR